MSNRLSRDTEDAAKVLSALRDKFHPRETLLEKLSAAEDLRAKLINVTTGVRRFSVRAAGDDTLVALDQAGTVRIATDPETGIVHVYGPGNEQHAPAIEYDPVNHEWVGSEHDPDIVAAPGDRRPRKSALVALTELIVRLLEGTQPA